MVRKANIVQKQELGGGKVVQRYTKSFRKKIYTDMENCMLKLY